MVQPADLLTPDLLTRRTLCLFAGLHAAADDAAGQRPPEVPGVLHRSPGHDVSVPPSGPAHCRQAPAHRRQVVSPVCNQCNPAQSAAEDRLPLHALHPLPAGLRERQRHPAGPPGEDGLDLLQGRHAGAHTVGAAAPPATAATAVPSRTSGILKLTSSFSNWGSESDQNLKFHNGNREPLGFGENQEAQEQLGLHACPPPGGGF